MTNKIKKKTNHKIFACLISHITFKIIVSYKRKRGSRKRNLETQTGNVLDAYVFWV